MREEGFVFKAATWTLSGLAGAALAGAFLGIVLSAAALFSFERPKMFDRGQTEEDVAEEVGEEEPICGDCAAENEG